MDRDKLRSLLQKMESEAQVTLSEDGSFLEALQALKSEIDSSYKVRAAMRAFRARGMRVFASLKPQIRVQIHAGETVLALPRDGSRAGSSEAPSFEDIGQDSNDPLVQQMLGAADAVLAASPRCRYLEVIISEAVQANRAFERMARSIESAGYELRICLDLTTYAQVHTTDSDQAKAAAYARLPQAAGTSLPGSVEDVLLLLSGPDEQFLKDLRIRIE